MEHPTGAVLGLDAMLRHVNSARPHAPVRPDPPRRRVRVPPAARRWAAAGLRRIADRLEPRPAPALPDGCAAG